MSELAKKLIAKEKKERTGKLDLGNCGLTDLEKEVPELFELVWLEVLLLGEDFWDSGYKKQYIYSRSEEFQNSIHQLPKKLLFLKKLEKLILSRNKIPKIENLPNQLQVLSLNQNNVLKIENLPQSLRVLDIGQNSIIKIENLPPRIEVLHIQYNNIEILENLPDSISELNIHGNRIKKLNNLPSNIKYLDVSLNKISIIDRLPFKLNKCDLRYNRISDISQFIPMLKQGIEIRADNFILGPYGGINILENPLSNPPLEIVKQGNSAILNYFRQLEEEKGKEEYLFETKLLIIGEAGSGKTTFAKRIKKADADMPDDSTHGIEIDTWTFDIPENTFEKLNHKEAKFHANLWDFGGQEIYHGTHQFFFSEKSLYVLLCDTREQKTDFRYWLNTVEQLCGENAHLFILFNRREDHDWQMDAGFKERFKSIIKDEHMIDLSVVESIPELQEKIKAHLHALPEVGQKLIQSWVEIRNDLAEEKANHISFDRFREICAKHGRTREDDIKNISRYFDRIGVFTHYMDDVVLRERVYLNSNHLVKTIYQLLDNGDIKKHHGRIRKKDIEAVWEKLGFEKERLPRLLEKFGLMYEVPNQSEYIIPEHLPDGAPYIHWKYENEKPQLHFRYEFDKYMPKGLMSRLIVALHKYIENHDMVWRRGVNICFRKAQAEITESLGGTNRFDIRITGDFRRDLLVVITEYFDDILSDFKKLSVSREVQCPCEECARSEEPYFHKMKDIEQAIIKKIRKKNPTVECKVSYEDVPIVQLLGMVNFEWVLEKTREKGRDMSMHHKLDELKNLLKEHDFRVNFQLEWIKDLNEIQTQYHDLILSSIDSFGEVFFDNIDEQNNYLEKIETLLSPAEKEELKWHDQELKHKLKVTLPLIFLKYEAEMDVSSFSVPKNWKEFKRWFLREG